MIFHIKDKSNVCLYDVLINNEDIEQWDSVTFLGISMVSNMKFNSQSSKIMKSLKSIVLRNFIC